MKHSPVWVLGLTTLMLGTASAVYAAPLNVDSASREVTPSYVATDVAAKEQPSTPFGSLGTSLWETVLEPGARSPANQSSGKEPREPPSARSPSTNELDELAIEATPNQATPDAGMFNDGTNDETNALPEVPLFQLPPFQANGDSPPSDRSSSDSPDSPDSSYSPDSSDRSPFTLPDDLTDAELFEQDSFSREPDELSRQPDRQPDRFLERQPANHQIESFPNAEAPPLLTDPPHAGRNPSPESPEALSGSLSEQSSARSQFASSVTASNAIGLNFDPPPASATRSFSAPAVAALDNTPDTKPDSEPDHEPNASSAPAELPAEPAKPNVADLQDLGASLDALFAGDSDSLVAIAVGSAEGTRGPDGSKNPAYQGHVDPGNGVWNLGSFSYQHGASSPEEADAKQLARLRSQAETILSKAEAKGLSLSLEERLNGIDLANQAPKAALDHQGYIDWLADARARGMTGSDAILWARVQSFIDPSTQTWDAPGLGNSETRITQDQERRMLAIAKAIALYLQDIANSAPFNDAANDGANDQAMQLSPDLSLDSFVDWSTA